MHLVHGFHRMRAIYTSMKMKTVIFVLLLISSLLILNYSNIHAQTYHFPVYSSYYTGYPVPYGRIWDDQLFKSWSFQWPRSYQSA